MKKEIKNQQINSIKEPLTRRQKLFLDFLMDFYTRNQYYPTLYECVENNWFTCFSTAQYYVRVLVEKGYLDKYKRSIRSIK